MNQASTATPGQGVLHGVRVVELAGIGPGPFCAMHLADLGADVIAVQRPDGRAGSIGYENCIQRGKRAIALDIKTPAGRDTLLNLVEHADVFIESMRPGVAERLGLGPDTCRARNPRLVYGRMTGWGQHGPMAQMAGHDANYIALSGALWNAGPADAAPVTPFSVVGDIAGGALYLSVGLLAGVLQARRTGQGCVVDAAVADGSAHSLQLLLAARSKGIVADDRGQSLPNTAPFYATYRCADGGYLTVAAIEPQFYALLLERLGLDADADFLPQWDRARWPQRKNRLQALFSRRTRAEWRALFEGSDACVVPVLTPEEAARDPHNMARATYFERDGCLQAAPAPRFDGACAQPGPVPRAGEHTQAVLDLLASKGPAAVWRDGDPARP